MEKMKTMKGKQEIISLLNTSNVEYEIISHEAVFTIDEMLSLNLPKAKFGAKNLFVRDDKKRNYFLFVVREEKMVNLKQMRERINSRPLSFASESDLYQYLGLSKGAVTPFGVINDETHNVKVYIDADFEHTLIAIHPNENTATVWLKTKDLVDLIKQQGNQVEYIDF
ncbi:prolyl-tRNA synthetase associated domain-containing protein [Sedimentibacter hydroxybenzoicus DSM 7310]|uniref:Prolyl-tRNA synthetase associated domain-containing protein n=1 Tax=Sedimentibacter hydroxybenzoicus DSM 7310 TaxID=1123245 RepID=A0A974BIQ5_SEDHY|nr:prolyl-tRNA synthetase associated domain-containing protein [Sedimentibacter hydroxybenzoicus]NYB73636.1 prolyl-tRNA synthetase associated domain-containing protein [Sedimentibacter hydroxybenzoicus DSM 7310]